LFRFAKSANTEVFLKEANDLGNDALLLLSSVTATETRHGWHELINIRSCCLYRTSREAVSINFLVTAIRIVILLYQHENIVDIDFNLLND
jgi:hypothetical protein